jgi:hypothetical protein
MEPGVFQAIPILASAVMAVSTVAALVWGIWTYRRGAETQVPRRRW